jgi:hypothetical protein
MMAVGFSDFGLTCYDTCQRFLGREHVLSFGPSENYEILTPFLGQSQSPICLLKCVKFAFISGEHIHHYLEYLRRSEIILSPSGFVRQTYRTFEIFQYGFISWIYQDSYISYPYMSTHVRILKIKT